MVGVLHQGHGGGAQLCQIERADVAGHAHRDAQRVVGQNGGEGHRQQGGLGGGAVVVGHKVHGLPCRYPGTAPRTRLPALPRCNGLQRRTYPGCRPCRSCPCCPQRAPAGSRCRGPCAPWCRRWRHRRGGFRCMVLPTMLADLVRAPFSRPISYMVYSSLRCAGLKPSISGRARLTMTLMA